MRKKKLKREIKDIDNIFDFPEVSFNKAMLELEGVEGSPFPIKRDGFQQVNEKRFVEFKEKINRGT